MASDSAWSQGWQTGSAAAAAQRARKEQLTDEERQLHIKTLYERGNALSKVIPSLSGDQRDKAMQDLTDIEQGIQQVYHPDNPHHGTPALARDWHLLAGLIHRDHFQKQPPPPVPITSPGATFTPDAQTVTLPETPAYGAPALSPWATPLDASTTPASLSAVRKVTQQPGTPASLPITLPSAPVTIPGTRQPSVGLATPEQRRQMAQRDAARKRAEIDVESAGLSPEDEQAQKDRLLEQSNDRVIAWAKKNGITDPDALQELTEHLAGLPQPKPKFKPLPGSKPYKAGDGLWYQTMQDVEGNIVEQAMPRNYVPPPSTAGPVRAWKLDANGKYVSVLLDRQTNKIQPGSENYDLLPPPYLTQHISTGVYHFADEDNQIHEIPETRTSGPALGGGGRPSGAAAAPSTAAAPAAPATGAAPAAGAKPRAGGAAPAAPAAGGGAPLVKGDRIIGTKGSEALNKARSDNASAVKIANLADDMVNDPSSEKDANFVMSLIRSESGRVNQKEIDMLFSAGGLAEGPERWAMKYGHGELPQTLRKQLQNLAKAQVKATQVAVDTLRGNPQDLKQKAKDNVDAGKNDDQFLRDFNKAKVQ
jgi:hypothetical protein